MTLTASAADLGHAIDIGRICPMALAEQMLDAIADHPEGGRIYVRTLRSRALAEGMAARARARSGMRRHPLDGVPVSWKDLFDIADTPTEGGSALLRGSRAQRDAELVRRGAMAGLVSLGKTHMTELAFSGLGLNPVTATPPGRHDPDRAPGGSSSGAAASVAHGLAAIGYGSDTGGSVRLPAAWNDLVGLKTTHGSVPMTGVLPLAARFDSIGPLARTVADAALALSVLDGRAPPDLTGARLGGARLMVLETVALDDLDPAVARAFDAALDRLAAAGARITRAALPEVAQAMDLAGVLYTSECYGQWGPQIEANPGVMYPPVRERFRAGASHPAHAFVAAWLALNRLRAAWAAATAGYDAVLMPTAPGLPPVVAPLLADAALFAAENLRALRNTRIGNLMGGCALTLPTGAPCVGLSLLAAPGHDRRLLRLGAAVERALG